MSQAHADRPQAGRQPARGPRPFPISSVIGTTLILVIAFALYDVLRGRELQPVGYAIMLILWPPAMIAGRAIYIWRMNRRARRS